ncbi:MAG: hypothetical protein ABFC89_04255 [Methanospirillum sp.]
MRIRSPIRGLLLAAVLIALGAAPVAAAAPYGESPAIAWQTLLGGNGTDYGSDAQQTSDGGYILLGYSDSSASGDVTGTNHGGNDLWVVKLDSAGTVQWQQLLGGSGNEYALLHSVQQTSDGGYVLVGSSYSSASGDVTGTNHGDSDYWVVKLDGAGTVQWQRLLGGIQGDWCSSVQQTSDGGYVLFGSSYSSASGDVAGTNHGTSLEDFWVVKLDGAGTVQWQELLGGNGMDIGLSAQQTSDGGYVLIGCSYSSASGDVAGTNHGDFDLWVVKLDGAGTAQWQQLLGGSGRDVGFSVRQTVDGGYILLGSYDSSASGDVAGTSHGGNDAWVVKLNGAGAIEWQKLLGGSGDEYGYSVLQNADGGYVLFGGSSSADGDITDTPHGLNDCWVVKLDSAGAIEWQKLLGGSGRDGGFSVQQTADGAYVLFGYSESSASGDVTGASHGGGDLWMVKLTGSMSSIPGAVGYSTDTDDDGLCDDVNGNGHADFADVVLYFNQMTWIAANEPMAAFDCNGNGRIDFADVVWLFDHL